MSGSAGPFASRFPDLPLSLRLFFFAFSRALSRASWCTPSQARSFLAATTLATVRTRSVLLLFGVPPRLIPTAHFRPRISNGIASSVECSVFLITARDATGIAALVNLWRVYIVYIVSLKLPFAACIVEQERCIGVVQGICQ